MEEQGKERRFRPEELSFEEKRRFMEAYDVAKRAMRYITGYLYGYHIELSSNMGKYAYQEPIEIHVKIYWKDEKIVGEAPVA